MLHCCIAQTSSKFHGWPAPHISNVSEACFPVIFIYTQLTCWSLMTRVLVCVCVWWVRRAGGFIVFWTTYRWSDKQARDGPRIQKMSHQLLIISFAHTLASSILSLIFLLCFQKVLQFFLSMIDQPSIIWWAQLLGRNHILIIYLDGGN